MKMKIQTDEKENIIRQQLTLRAILWDVSETAADRLDREIKGYQLLKLKLAEDGNYLNTVQKYELICKRLQESGIAGQEALLVTEDRALAEYMKDLTVPGTAVVFYERREGSTCAAADYIVQGFEETGVQFFDRILKRKNRLPWNILYTARTCVREITLSDMEELFALYQGKGITDYTEPLYDWQKEEEYIRSYISYMYHYYGYGMWMIRERKTGRLLGRAGIEHREEEGRVLMELGYIIGTEYQNQGYATEVCQAVMEYAAEELEIKQLHCFIHKKNGASLRVAAKLGFVLSAGIDPPAQDMLHFMKDL